MTAGFFFWWCHVTSSCRSACILPRRYSRGSLATWRGRSRSRSRGVWRGVVSPGTADMSILTTLRMGLAALLVTVLIAGIIRMNVLADQRDASETRAAAARQAAETLASDLAEAKTFSDNVLAAYDAATASYRAAAEKRQAQLQALQWALTQGASTDANLSRCLSYRLPDSVLAQLPQ